MLSVSIIIPTKNRKESLQECLTSLVEHTSYPYKELIVVDSSDEKRIREENEKFVGNLNGIYVHERRRGVSIARNAGLKIASGDILVFLDDDFVVTKGWLRVLIRNYQEKRIACCTGRMLPRYHDEMSRIYERTLSFDKGPTSYLITHRDMSIKGLLRTIRQIGKKRLGKYTPPPYSVGYGFYSFRRKIFSDISPFDEKLGRGTRALGGEDPDIFYRILGKGYKIYYEAQSVIYHKHRQKWEDLLRDAYSSGVSVKAFTRKYVKKDPYILLVYIGTFFFLLFAFLRNRFSDSRLSTMILTELRGFLSSI